MGGVEIREIRMKICWNLIRVQENKELKSESRDFGSKPTSFEAQLWLGVVYLLKSKPTILQD